MLQSHKHNDSGHAHSISPSDFYYIQSGSSGFWGQSAKGTMAWRFTIGTGYANLGNAAAYGDSGTVTTGSENRPENFTIRIWRRVS